MTGRAPSSALPRRTQDPCCYTSAVTADATYCGECGKPLVRCMAAEECGGLLDDQGLCTVCVAPEIQVDPGALKAAKVGGAIALAMSITNASVVGRPLFVTGLWSREAQGDWREEPLVWERLNAGQSRPMTITANQLNKAGTHNLEILVAISSRWRWREESFAFTSTMQLIIEKETSKSAPVVTIGGDSAGHGNTVYISGQSEPSTASDTTTEARSLRMVRAEKEERKFGLRGLSDELSIPKNATLAWRGFRKQDTPSDGPILTTDGILAVGRTRSRQAGGLGDVRLLVTTPEGEVDADASRLLSRRHFELYIECNRLILRVTGSGGVRVNGDAYGPGKTISLNDGDRIDPLVKTHGALTLDVRFNAHHGSISDVTITRSPICQRED